MNRPANADAADPPYDEHPAPEPSATGEPTLHDASDPEIESDQIPDEYEPL